MGPSDYFTAGTEKSQHIPTIQTCSGESHKPRSYYINTPGSLRNHGGLVGKFHPQSIGRDHARGVFFIRGGWDYYFTATLLMNSFWAMSTYGLWILWHNSAIGKFSPSSAHPSCEPFRFQRFQVPARIRIPQAV